MALLEPEPLDERVWSDPNFGHWGLGGISTDTVHHYFIASIFCEPDSANKIAQNQLRVTEEDNRILQTAAKFEEHLKTRTGIQYFIEHDPTYDPQKEEEERRARESKFTKTKDGKPKLANRNGIPDTTNTKGDQTGASSVSTTAAEGPFPGGAWVMRKQLTTPYVFVNDRGETERRANVKVLGYYFIAGFNIFQAPSVANVLNSRMLRIYKLLGETLQTAQSMPRYSAALGNYYEAENAQTRSQTQSQQRTAQASKETTPMPNANMGTNESASAVTSAAASRLGSAFGANLLAESLNLSLRYGEEYMDENPLSGLPGNFKINKLRPDGSLVEQKLGAFNAKQSTPLPPPIDTSVRAENPLMKGAKDGGGGGKSPTTPGGTKKRKRNKGTAAAAAVATPK